MTDFKPDDSIEDISSSQHIRDLKMTIEYKHCCKNAPGGVYIIPLINDMRKFDGVIFLRRGLYRNGVFRFSLTLPEDYNSHNSYPKIEFEPPIFNPMIDPKSGTLDLRLEPVLKEWIPEKHFITTALFTVKKTFYLKSYDDYTRVLNEDARKLFNTDKEGFLKEVQKTVEQSLHRVYLEPSPLCMIQFTEPKPAHDIIREKMFSSASDVDDVRQIERSDSPSPDKTLIDSAIMESDD